VADIKVKIHSYTQPIAELKQCKQWGVCDVAVQNCMSRLSCSLW